MRQDAKNRPTLELSTKTITNLGQLALVYGIRIVSYHFVMSLATKLSESLHSTRSTHHVITAASPGTVPQFRCQAPNRSRVQRVAPKNEALLKAQSEDRRSTAQLSTHSH